MPEAFEKLTAGERLNRLLITALALACAAAAAAAQTPDPISADRPSNSAGSSAVPFATFQVEAGFNFERSRPEPGQDTLGGPFLLRVGVLPGFELRYDAAGPTRRSTERIGAPDVVETGYGASSVGAKWNFARIGDGLASFGVMGMVELAAASRPFEPDSATPELTFLADFGLPAGLSITTNVGVSIPRDPSDGHRRARTEAIFLLGASVGERVSVFGEIVGRGASERGSESEGIVDGGMTVLLANNFSVDAFVSRGFGGADNWAAGAGLSFRLPR